ncbi:LuxR C-terminal-related transcriptional regulator [Pseudomonas xantholysinigenes]|uniref:Helix-turn-helix transcriptional regulator n=1 Tax=Pseudomonas xantholysinigenes TaxID=2745490 RepID=A0A9E6PT26_9PSED|nr:helix-turn-helix transcriptional regulator [Pseudomonas xantholysinigenes]QXI36870.1 helix-turn-helix transcriptional regulator [Pseudomonas xantholysinigenes]
MGMSLQDLSWHQGVAHCIEHLDRPSFWRTLATLLGDFVEVDTWVALLFSHDKPLIFDQSPYLREGTDPLVSEYANGLYLLDPFYISSREQSHTGLVRLADVAPEQFQQTDYYRLYFTHNVVADEVQFNLALGDGRTLCLSLGGRSRFDTQAIAQLELARPWLIGLMRQRLHFEQLPACAPAKPALGLAQGRDEARRQLESVLTARELDVVRLILSGHSNKETAIKLKLSAETVKVHRRNVYRKLDVNSQTELFSLLFLAGEDLASLQPAP